MTLQLSGFRCSRHQQGAVLFVALVFLILLTLLALTATSTSILQEKMTGGMRNRQLGLMGAESALRGGEAFFTTADFGGENPLPACGASAGGVCAYRPQNGISVPDAQKFRSSGGWITAPAGALPYARTLTALTGDAITASLHAQPQILIEDLGANVPSKKFRQTGIIDPESGNAAWIYRVTARSQGGSGAVVRVAESIFSPSKNLGNLGANTPAPPSP